MDAELKAKWVKALRSGEYKQGQGMLRNYNDTYCCIGVLCLVMGKKITLDGQWVEGAERATSDTLIPHQMHKDSGISPDEVRHLAFRMNDAGASFPRIADYIEANL